MPQSFWKIFLGLLFAFLAAACVALFAGLPLSFRSESSSGLSNFLSTLMPIATYALPGALAAIALAEARHVKGLLYYLFVGVLIASLGFLLLTRAGAPAREIFQSLASYRKFFAMGLAGGWIYWLMAGKNAGRVAADFARMTDGSIGETGARKRCRKCMAFTFLLGLLPLALLGWYAYYANSAKAVPAITAKAETDAKAWLEKAGLKDVKFTVDNHIGHVTGTVTDALSKTAVFEKAKIVLAPMVGKPGVVEYLQNDIVTADASQPSDDAEKRKAEEDAAAARAKAEELKRLAEEKRKQDDDADAKAKLAEEQRIAAEAKRKAEEDAAAKAKAEEEARLAAEAKKKAEEEAVAKAKADEDARLAAEAKRKAEEDIAAKLKADEDARLLAEAEAERKAVEAARKAAEEAKKAELAPPPTPDPTPAPAPSPTASCGTDFSDLFRSYTVKFALNSADLGDESSGFLDRVAATAQRCKDLAITVDGHTDRRGNIALNEALARARASTVRNALVSRGIESERVVASSYASDRPYDPTNTEAAYGLNRRVDFGTKPYTPSTKPAEPLKDQPAPDKEQKAEVKSETPKETFPPYAPPEPKPEPMASSLCSSEFSRLFLSDNVRFIGSSADVDDSHAAFLDKVASLALSCPNFTLNLDGHTDRRGHPAFNQFLSESRANAVRDALAERDVPESRMVARGYAGERPFDPGNTPEAYALNRRVDFGVAEKTSTK